MFSRIAKQLFHGHFNIITAEIIAMYELFFRSKKRSRGTKLAVVRIDSFVIVVFFYNDFHLPFLFKHVYLMLFYDNMYCFVILFSKLIIKYSQNTISSILNKNLECFKKLTCKRTIIK